MMNVPWTDTRKAEAAKLWNDGFSSRQIAMQFCVSRNSVIGVAHRNPDLFLPKTAGNQKRPSRAKPEPRMYVRQLFKPKIALPKFETLSEAPVSLRRTVQQIGDYECRAPTAGEGASMEMCGHPALKIHRYCAFHQVALHGVGTISERRAA